MADYRNLVSGSGAEFRAIQEKRFKKYVESIGAYLVADVSVDRSRPSVLIVKFGVMSNDSEAIEQNKTDIDLENIFPQNPVMTVLSHAQKACTDELERAGFRLDERAASSGTIPLRLEYSKLDGDDIGPNNYMDALTLAGFSGERFSAINPKEIERLKIERLKREKQKLAERN